MVQMIINAELMNEKTGPSKALETAKSAVDRFRAEGDLANEAMALQTVARTCVWPRPGEVAQAAHRGLRDRTEKGVWRQAGRRWWWQSAAGRAARVGLRWLLLCWVRAVCW